MENYTYKGNNQLKIERFLLAVYTVYCATMIRMSFERTQSYFIGYFILTGLSICIIMYVARFKSYELRAFVCAITLQAGIILYSGYLENISKIYPVFMLFVVLMGLYGLPKLIYVTVISQVFLVLYHGLILKTLHYTTFGEWSALFFQMVHIFFLQYIVYVWTKKNREGSEQLLDTIKELEEVQSSKDDFLANVSHEIRTPLNTICGMSEIVLKEELSDKVRSNIRDIDMAGRNLMTVVRDILDFSELMSGKMELEEESYNITSTINDIINMATARRNGKRIEIIVNCDMNIPAVLLGDEKKLRRVMMNLVDNALKFTNEGCITIKIQQRRESYGINLIVTVKDTGIGMTEESLEKICASFTQVDTSRKRVEGGLGLGLTISNALIQKMGGAMTMKSRPGKGTTVQFVLPQNVLVDQPIIEVRSRSKLNIACYIDMEQFRTVEMRDEYAEMIMGMASQMKEKYHICRNFVELQRRQENEGFTHIFTSIIEYVANTKYFDDLAKETNVIVILDDRDERYVTNPQIKKLYKPFYALSIASMLNGLYDSKDERHAASSGNFLAERAHVLVVDDNKMNLRVIEGLLSEYRIRVTTANSGKEALEKVSWADFDFIFMDHMMPEMDGVETLHKIRQMVGTYFQKVPIVALTANAVAGTREMLMEEGFSDFLEKPVERSVLERILKRNLVPEKIVFLEDEVKEEQQPQEELDEKEHLYGRLEACGIDVKKGIFYCNGAEKFANVLHGFCEDYEDSAKLTQKLFDAADWKNYTIAVHGIKGSMGSIGAIAVSEQAKGLEYAGKEDNIKYILSNHEKLMKAYQELYLGIKNSFLAMSDDDPVAEAVAGGEKAEQLPELAEEEFDRRLEELEDAAYSLEEDRMLELVTELQRYQYNGTSLKEAMAPVRRKIEMSDGISAAELAGRIKKKLQGEEE